MFQIMPDLYPHGQGEGGGQPNADRPGQGEEEVPKIPKFVRTSFMDDPIMNIILASVQIACMIIGSE